MFYLVQENTFKEQGFDDLIASFERLGLEYEIVKAPPFVEEIEFKTTRKDVFAFGALKMARLASKYDWFPGMLMTPNHDYEAYRPHYGANLLNYDSKVVPIVEDIKWEHEQYFIRPTLDSKNFTGRVFFKNTWKKFRNELFENGYTQTLTPDTLVQYAEPKKIYKEIRFFIVGDKIVTGSQYRLGQYTLAYSDIIDNEAYEFCQKMIAIFKLAEAFVMDVCLTPDGWKIVECGCINCAGFYKADMMKLICALEEHFGSKEKKDPITEAMQQAAKKAFGSLRQENKQDLNKLYIFGTHKKEEQ
jgi:hypothetical protein